MSEKFPERCLKKLGPHQYCSYWRMLGFLLNSYVKQSSVVLDAGCGSGGHLLMMISEAEGISLDLNRQNIKKAIIHSKDHYHLSFIVGDIEKIPFRSEVFDFIICCDVLEHLINQEIAIKNLASCLRMKGKLLLATSNRLNPIMLIDSILPKQTSDKIAQMFHVTYYERTHRFNPKTLTKKLSKLGLLTEKIVIFWAPPIKVFHKILYFWIMFDRLTNIGFFKILKRK